MSAPAVIDVVGELDIASAAEMRGRIARAAIDPAREIVVDLSAVTFVDCAGLGALLAAQRRLGDRLSLQGLSQPVAWLIELADLRTTLGADESGPGADRPAHGSRDTSDRDEDLRAPPTGQAAAHEGEIRRSTTVVAPGVGAPSRGAPDRLASSGPGTAPAPVAPRLAPTGTIPITLTAVLAVEAANERSSFAAAASAVITYLQVQAPMDLWLLTRVTGPDQVVVAAEGPWSPSFAPGTALPWLESFGARMATGDAPALALCTADVPLYAAAATGRWDRVRSFTGTPLRSDEDEVFGTLCGFSGRTGDPRAVQAAVTVRLLGQLLSTILTTQNVSALSRDRIEDARALAETDALTGLLNRHGWQVGLAREDQRAGHADVAADLLVVDLDRLKVVNDRYGHHTGDEVLRRTAEILTRSCRSGDLVARPGGDEFAVLAVARDGRATTRLADRIEHDLAAAGIAASVGQATHARGEHLHETWIRADEAMFVEKRRRHGHTLLADGTADS